MNRTRAQRRERRRGYTHEITYLRDTLLRAPNGMYRGRKLVYLCTPQRHKNYRKHLLPGEIIRPVATTYIHKGRKP